MVGIPLEAASPGDYVLVMRVKDEFSGNTLERREPFHISAAPGPKGA
jgi:hypothetical protein